MPSKIQFRLKKLRVPRSLAVAGKVLAAVDTLLDSTVADLIAVESFARGGEVGFSLSLHDWETDAYLRLAFAEEYRTDQIIIYYAPGIPKIADFFRELSAYKNERESVIQVERVPSEKFKEAANFICGKIDDALDGEL